MGEYILPENEANMIRHQCEVAKEIDSLLAENNLFEPHKEQSSKVTIIVKDEHIPIIDEIMLACIAVLHGPKKG